MRNLPSASSEPAHSGQKPVVSAVTHRAARRTIIVNASGNLASDLAVGNPEAKPARVCGTKARVVANTRICREHVAIELALPRFPRSQPGQFVQLQCTAASSDEPRVVDWPTGGFPSLAQAKEWMGREPFLRRPFSIADAWTNAAGQIHLMVISRTIGPGTAWLEQLQPEDAVDVTGPLGRGFTIPDNDVPVALVGGGVGVPPLLYLARRLHELGRTSVTVIFGAATRDSLPVQFSAEPAADATPLPCAALPGEARFPALITTEDGSVGLPGVVTDALRLWQARLADEGQKRGAVFACGPEGMLKAVAELTRRFEMHCQLCIERRMGCGLGTCLSCVVRAHDETRPEGWRWVLACTDGPVFDRDQLVDFD
jgi:dihydroorotate dehydrogenase electron transfer subunit